MFYVFYQADSRTKVKSKPKVQNKFLTSDQKYNPPPFSGVTVGGGNKGSKEEFSSLISKGCNKDQELRG